MSRGSVANHISDDQLRLAARLYYIDGLAQAQVAKMVKVSQSKVSRLLALARERGLVRITVTEYEPRDQSLEQTLCSEFKLNSAAVIKSARGALADEVRHGVGFFGAAYVSNLVSRNSSVAIAGGRTMRELIQSWPEDRSRGITVVQAMGSIDATAGPVDALELGRTLAWRCGGFFVTLNTPAFLPDKRIRDSFMEHDQMRGVWRRLRKCQVALVGIGTLANSIFVERGVLTSEDLQNLKRQGAVGEICGRFYDKSGAECASPWRDRVMAIELQTLRSIPEVVGVISGTDRAEAIRAAIRGGLIKSLLIDEAGAREILHKNKS